MQIAQLGMKPLANNFPIPHNDSPHKRIRTDFPTPTLPHPLQSGPADTLTGQR